MVELVDTQARGACGGNSVWVRVPPSALSILYNNMRNNMHKYILFFLLIIFNILFGSVDEHISKIQKFIGNGEYLMANEEFELAIKAYDANAPLYFIYLLILYMC